MLLLNLNINVMTKHDIFGFAGVALVIVGIVIAAIGMSPWFMNKYIAVTGIMLFTIGILSAMLADMLDN